MRLLDSEIKELVMFWRVIGVCYQILLDQMAYNIEISLSVVFCAGKI